MSGKPLYSRLHLWWQGSEVQGTIYPRQLSDRVVTKVSVVDLDEVSSWDQRPVGDVSLQQLRIGSQDQAVYLIIGEMMQAVLSANHRPEVSVGVEHGDRVAVDIDESGVGVLSEQPPDPSGVTGRLHDHASALGGSGDLSEEPVLVLQPRCGALIVQVEHPPIEPLFEVQGEDVSP